MRAGSLSSLLGFAAVGCSDDGEADEPHSHDHAQTGGGAAAKPDQPGKPTKQASWTMMGYDGSNNYHQPDESILTVDNASQLKEQWRYKTPGYAAGSPIVKDGVVYLSATGGLSAVELATGKELWAQPDVKGTSSPAYHDGHLYVHAAAGASLYKLKASDGTVVWGPVKTYPENPSCDGTSSAIIAGDKIIVGHSCGAAEVTGGEAQKNSKGGVEALSMENGTRMWTYWTVEGDETGAMVWSTVAVDMDTRTIFATTGNNYTVAGDNSDAIHAIDLETGKRKWRKQVRAGDLWSLRGMVVNTGEDTDFGANPILAKVGDMPIVAAGDKGSAFWALKRETGEILWSRDDLSAAHSPANGGVLMNGAYDGKYFYVASNEPPDHALLHVLDAKDGRDVREPKRLDAIVWGAVSLANGLLFVPVNSWLHVFNAATGDELTKFDTGGTVAAGAATIADGRVIVKSGLQYSFARDAINTDAVICYGLGDPEPSQTKPDERPQAGAATWSGIYNDIIVNKGCAGNALCHAGEAGGQLVMKDRDSSYKALVDVAAMGTNAAGGGPNCADSGLKRVVPNKPDESLFVQKLEGTEACGMEMPPGAKLPDAQLKQVRDWISNGAQND